MSTKALALRRIGPGLYETEYGAYQIVRGAPGVSWAGQWVYRSTTDRYACSDPMPTIADARAALAAARAA